MEKYQKVSIKNWAIDDRPREKMLKKGIASLSDAELVAILIGSGSRTESAVEVAKHILNSVDKNLNDLGKLSVPDLVQVDGIGEAKAINIVAALELGKRRKHEKVKNKNKISSSKDVFDFFFADLCDLPHEEFWILILNRSNQIIKSIKISQGGISGTVTDVRIIMHEAIIHKATSVILVHNHPSGNINPSNADVKITEKIKKAAELMDINILDHVIFTDEQYLSFADEGLI